MNFPEIGPAYAPKIKISKIYWMSFPEIGLCHTPEFVKHNFPMFFFGLVFQKSVSVMPQNSKIDDWYSKKRYPKKGTQKFLWMSFP